MALKGISRSLAERGIQTDLKLGVLISAGAVVQLGSGSNFLRLPSNQISHVVDADVTATGVEAADVIFGIGVYASKINEPAYVRSLAPGDTFRTDQLASAGSSGAVAGTTTPGTALGVDPLTGKIRLKQATDSWLFSVAPDGGANTYDNDGFINVEVMALKV